MYVVIELPRHGVMKITQCQNREIIHKILSDIAAIAADESALLYRLTHNEDIELYTSKSGDVTVIVFEKSAIELNTLVPNGRLQTNTCGDDDYPGVDIEYIPDNESEYPDVLTRPRVRIEKPVDSEILAAMLWTDKNDEDYTHKHTFA